MRILRLWCLVALGSVQFAIGANDQAKTEIENLVHRYIDIRNRNDGEALQALFTRDADQLVSTGQWRRGLEDIVRGAMASSRRENGQSTIRLETVRLLGPDTAIADGQYETVDAKTKTTRKMWSTFFVLRKDGVWRIAAIRNMLPVPTNP